MYIRMHLLIVMRCMYKILSNRVELKVYVFIIYARECLHCIYTLSTYTHVHICLWYTLQSMSYIINFAFFHVYIRIYLGMLGQFSAVLKLAVVITWDEILKPLQAKSRKCFLAAL